MIGRLTSRLRELWQRTQPVDPDTERALAWRWAELPEHVRTPSQLLGRRHAGCEGTHGVFRAATSPARRAITLARPIG